MILLPTTVNLSIEQVVVEDTLSVTLRSEYRSQCILGSGSLCVLAEVRQHAGHATAGHRTQRDHTFGV